MPLILDTKPADDQDPESAEQRRVAEVQHRYAREWAQKSNPSEADRQDWFARCFSELTRRTDKDAASTDLQ